MPANIASALTAMAKLRPNDRAVIVSAGRNRANQIRFSSYTFQQLDLESDLLSAGFSAAGIGKGVRTAVMVKPGLPFYAITFALFKAGAIPILVDPGIGIVNLKACFATSKPEAFIGILRAQLARALLGWGKETIRTVVSSGPRLGLATHSVSGIRRMGSSSAFLPPDLTAEDTAAILFTSGSTGIPKGAVYTHANFNAQVELLRDLYGIEPGEVDVATFPLFGLFGPALGMTSVVPHMDATRPAQADPREIIACIRQFRATSMFASPALIDRLSRFCEKASITLPGLKRVLSAGAPADNQALQRLSKALPDDVEIFTPYGATEALPVASIGSHEIIRETMAAESAGAGVCVGRSVPGMDVRVISISDDPIELWSTNLEVARGEIGEIVVRGPVVTGSYFNHPTATSLAKIEIPGGGFYHRMGDVGYIDARERIWFCGRKSQRVVTPQGTLHTIVCERIFNIHPEVRRTALVGVQKGGRNVPILCVELNEGVRSSRETIRAELLAIGAAHEITSEIRDVLFHPKFPVDIRHNAKIQREKLARWAASRTGPT